MNELQKNLFESLREHQLGLANTLNDPSLRGVREVISNLYHDDAHFVYELLQNADDQGATFAKFILSNNELVFIHNAPKLFTISDYTKHAEDQALGKLGDINSILSIASSSKSSKNNDVKIGKFGLGFKSVFLFTDEPEIFDDNFRFSITNYIVPTLIETDHPLRRTGETLFRFKFKVGDEDEAYKKIIFKLRNLVNPLLFLNNLKNIEWEAGIDDSGHYRLSNIGRIGTGHRLKYEIISEDNEKELELWKFDRPIESGSRLFVSVVYCIENGKLSTLLHPLYCFLPTTTLSNLPVLLHAPFKLTGNRESIMAGDSHNQKMISLLSQLLVDSLKEICSIGESSHNPLIKDEIINFLPKNDGEKTEETTQNIDITPLTSTVKNALKDNALLWCEQLSCYLSSDESVIADNNYLSEVYPAEILEHLLGERKGWVLPSITSDIRKNFSFLRILGIEHITPEKILRKISKDFLADRSDEWLCAWYKSLLKVPNLWGKGQDAFLRFLPIIRSSDNNQFLPPFIKGETSPNVFLTKTGVGNISVDGFNLVDPILLEDEDVKLFFEHLGLKTIDSFSIAEKVYLPKITSRELSFEERLRYLLWFIGVFDNMLTSSQQKQLLPKCLFPAFSQINGWEFCDIDFVKLHNDDNDFFYMGNKEARFFEDSLLPNITEEERGILSSFIEKFEIVKSPTVIYKKLTIDDNNQSRIPDGAQRPAKYNQGLITKEVIEEPTIWGFDFFIKNNASLDPKRASSLINRHFKDKFGFAYYNSIYYSEEFSYEIEPLYKNILRQAPWIELASNDIKKWLDFPIHELQAEELESVRDMLSSSGIVSQKDVEDLLEFMTQRGVLKDFQMNQSIEEQRSVVSASPKSSLKWFKEVLNLRLKYVEAGEKQDIDFLINRLLKALETLTLNDEIDLREVLPDNINVIYGPPGTGKTTEITKIITSSLNKNKGRKILVLTPTNAAAKVVAERLVSMGISAYRGINSANLDLCNEMDEAGIPIFEAAHDMVPEILICTVQYFTQTFASKEGSYLHELSWDSIFIDESSMVTLDYVLFTLLKSQQINQQCIYYIVGDPLQLPPITNLDPSILEEAQLDEFNFYSFIGLSDFTDKIPECPDSLRDKIKIHLLTTQYRSVPPLCEIMSKFSYKGKVKSGFVGKSLELPENVPQIFKNPLAEVRFPISNNISGEFPTITDLDKLNGSNFNFYSALLVKEALQALFTSLHISGYHDKLTIGIITPYIAQKKLIEQLLNTNPVTRDINIDVAVNTVHQFQGDEFDIVMLVLNPPNREMNPKNKILINKRYLINVAISRAKYTLIILYPDHSCEERNFIHINRKGDANNIETIAEKVLNCRIDDISMHSKVLEEKLFGNSNYLSGICEVKFHEDVNLHHSKSNSIYRFVKGGNTIDILYSNPE